MTATPTTPTARKRKAKYSQTHLHLTDAHISAVIKQIVADYRGAACLSDVQKIALSAREEITKLFQFYSTSNVSYWLQVAGRSAFSLANYDGHLMEDIAGVLLGLSQARLALREVQ